MLFTSDSNATYWISGKNVNRELLFKNFRISNDKVFDERLVFYLLLLMLLDKLKKLKVQEIFVTAKRQPRKWKGE